MLEGAGKGADAGADTLGLMKVSLDRGIYTRIDVARVSRGAHYTEEDCWLTPAVEDFMARMRAEYGLTSVLDPYAGDGHILRAVGERMPGMALHGLDLVVDKWPKNDSLLRIDAPPGALICTNPPYLAKSSARRKGVDRLVQRYFDASSHDDLYLVALERMLQTGCPVVAIIPETFVSSGEFRAPLRVLVILEKHNPFGSTETPVCVACFDPRGKPADVQVYRDATHLGVLSGLTDLGNFALVPRAAMKFNVVDGPLALKAVDGTSADDRIRFMPAAEFRYCDSMIKVSSRLMTKLQVDGLERHDLGEFARRCNTLLEEVRARTQDLVLSPFKGNNKAGTRRRRLDYRLARMIVGQVLADMDAGKVP